MVEEEEVVHIKAKSKAVKVRLKTHPIKEDEVTVNEEAVDANQIGDMINL